MIAKYELQFPTNKYSSSQSVRSLLVIQLICSLIMNNICICHLYVWFWLFFECPFYNFSKKCSWHFAFLDFWIICMSWAVAIFGFSVMLLCYWMQKRKWYEGCFQIAVFMIWAGSIVGMEISTRQENSDPNNVSGFCRIFLIIWLILFCFFMFVMRSKEFFLTENLVVAIANHGSFFMMTAAQCNHGSNLSP